MILRFIFAGIIVGLVVGLRTFLNPCEEISCIINVFFAAPLGIAAGFFTVLALWIAWRYAQGKSIFVMYLAELGVALLLSILVSASFRSHADWPLLLQTSIHYVLTKLWFVYLLGIGISAMAILLIRLKDVQSRFIFFMVVFLIVGAVHGSAFGRITSMSYQNQIQEAALASNNVDGCLELMPSLRDACFWEFAQKRTDAELCQRIKGDDRDSCLVRIARSTNNLQLCKMIHVSAISEECYTYFATRPPLDEQLCYSIVPYQNPATTEHVVQRCVNHTRETARILSTIPK